MEHYLVKPESRVSLSKFNPDDTGNFEGTKKEARKELKKLVKRLSDLQEVLYAERKNKILIVLQAMDTGGKDGAIRKIFSGINPQGIRIASFKTPTPYEADRDYLWRIHQRVPTRGEIVVFNRSHYEDVLIVRVRNFVPKPVWSRRYDHINEFERMLTEEGTTIMKFFLNISHEEQKRRLESRLANPKKRWKFNPDDLNERKMWPKYINAYEDVLSKTSTIYAPWYIIPANSKWYRDLVIAGKIIDTLEGLKMKHPKAQFNHKDYKVD